MGLFPRTPIMGKKRSSFDGRLLIRVMAMDGLRSLSKTLGSEAPIFSGGTLFVRGWGLLEPGWFRRTVRGALLTYSHGRSVR